LPFRLACSPRLSHIVLDGQRLIRVMGSVFVTKSREPDPEETDNQYSYAQITFGGAYFFLYPAILRLRDQTGELIDPQTCAFFDGTILDELERFLNESRQRVLAEPSDWEQRWARRSRAVNRSTNARLKPRCSSFWINYIAPSCSLVNRVSVCSSWVIETHAVSMPPNSYCNGRTAQESRG
jgi:hypothetical protein